jgi:putative FmdB family regulatory protein
MPIYTYRAKDPEHSCPHCIKSLEVFQGIREEALAECTECGNPVVRLLHGASLVKDDSTKKILSDENLKKHGFKKLVNAGGGKFDEVV